MHSKQVTTNKILILATIFRVQRPNLIFLFFPTLIGLHRDDVLYENDDVKEAVRRLPRQLYDERNYRIMRALHLSMTKTILPKEQWTKYEDDVKYLEPYLNEVIKEREEREEWNKNH